MECADLAPVGDKFAKGNKMSYVLSHRQQSNGLIYDAACIRAVFEELENKEQKELLVELVQDFT